MGQSTRSLSKLITEIASRHRASFVRLSSKGSVFKLIIFSTLRSTIVIRHI